MPYSFDDFNNVNLEEVQLLNYEVTNQTRSYTVGVRRGTETENCAPERTKAKSINPNRKPVNQIWTCMSQLNKQLKIVAVEYERSSQMCNQSDFLTAIKQSKIDPHCNDSQSTADGIIVDCWYIYNIYIYIYIYILDVLGNMWAGLRGLVVKSADS